MKPKTTPQQRQALEEHHGLVEAADGQCVFMSMQVFREMMGVDTDEELAASLKAIEEGLADVEAGRTRPFRDVLDELS